MKILVTGAGGFIGSHLVEKLAERGDEVRALVRYNGRGDQGHLRELPKSYKTQVSVVAGDITDPSFVRGLVAGCDVVIHLAALIGIPYSYTAPLSYVATNIQGTVNVLEACRAARLRRVVITSTSEVYGTARYTPIDEDHPLQGQSPYSASKIAADKLAESYFRSFDLPVVVLRPFNTYGPRQSARAVIPTVISQALAGAREIRLGNLKPKRDLTFVSDAVRAFVTAVDAEGIDGEVIHFGQGKAITIGELAMKCIEASGSQAIVVADPDRHRPDKSEVGLLLCDPAKAQGLLNWRPEVSLDEGLATVAEYIRAHMNEYRSEDYVV